MLLNSQFQAVDYGQLKKSLTYNNSDGNIKTYKWCNTIYTHGKQRKQEHRYVCYDLQFNCALQEKEVSLMVHIETFAKTKTFMEPIRWLVFPILYVVIRTYEPVRLNLLESTVFFSHNKSTLQISRNSKKSCRTGP